MTDASDAVVRIVNRLLREAEQREDGVQLTSKLSDAERDTLAEFMTGLMMRQAQQR